MGSVSKGHCFASQEEAADAYFLATEPAYTAGSISYLSYYEKVGGTWVIVRKSIDSNGVVTSLTSSTAPVPAFPSCDPMERFTDGVSLGWLLAGVIVLAWGLTMVRRQVA